MPELNFRPDILRSTFFDLIQFINLFQTLGVRRTYIRLTFDDLKHSWVTVEMDTIWQLSSRRVQQMPHGDAIGSDDIAEPEFFIHLARGLAEVNPTLQPMLAYIKYQKHESNSSVHNQFPSQPR